MVSLGQRRVLKEAKVTIESDGKVSGFLDLVSKGKILIEGKIEYLNDTPLEEKRKEQKFPIIIHFKIKNPLKENQNAREGLGGEPETPKEFLKHFNGNQKLGQRINIYCRRSFLSTETSSQPRNDIWGFGGALHEMNILEAKNVPGLKDVKKK